MAKIIGLGRAFKYFNSGLGYRVKRRSNGPVSLDINLNTL